MTTALREGRTGTPTRQVGPAEHDLQDRYKAALSLIRAGMTDDPALMLSYVLWPTPALEAAAESPQTAG